ncbi:MAG: hypothetical protein IKO42_01825 [Opitutales bacterium]|nr:hypothetical protein [Opitutales bacterium]
MNRLCFWLACFFGLLSVVFGAYSVLHSAPEQNAAQNKEPEAAARWGADLLKLARKSNKLIFFSLEGADEPEFSPAARKILESRYIYVKLSPQKYPADNAVLLDIYKNSGARGRFSVGILSPQGAPIFLASALSSDSRSPFYDAACLAGAVNLYGKNRSADFANLKNSAAFFRRADFPFMFISGNSAANLADLAVFFASKSWGENTALLTENARLAARLARSSHPIALGVAESAYESLLSEPADGLRSKLLVARSLSEFAILMLSPTAQQNFLARADEILALQSPDGLFYENSAAILRDNSLALSVLARAFLVSAEPKYEEALEKSAKEILSILKNKNIPPSILKKTSDKLPPSETQGIGCALLARAFLDCHLATSKPLFLSDALRMFEIFDAFFADKRTGDWYCNLPGSMFAPTYRMKNFSDTIYPCDNGEGAQLLADLSHLRGANSARLMNIAANFEFQAGFGAIQNASMKLALMSNPMFRKSAAALKNR